MNNKMCKLSVLHVTCLLVPIYAFTKYYQNFIKIFQTIKKLLCAQEFGLEIYSAEITRKRTKQELSFLHVTLLLLSNSQQYTCTRFWYQER